MHIHCDIAFGMREYLSISYAILFLYPGLWIRLIYEPFIFYSTKIKIISQVYKALLSVNDILNEKPRPASVRYRGITRSACFFKYLLLPSWVSGTR